jgi:DNA-binding MarR family transcriptional regulator
MELECRLLLAQHSVSRLVDRMVAKSVTRKREAAGDGRGHLVELTQEGRADA